MMQDHADWILAALCVYLGGFSLLFALAIDRARSRIKQVSERQAQQRAIVNALKSAYHLE